jgi:hypothetical protein
VLQTVGLTDVEVNYSRPGARGRAVFGNLVPFGKLWRTGANENTTVSFSDDVIIDGKTLKKGKYALYTIPKIESWEIIFYATTDNWGTPQEFNEANVALRTTVKEEALPKAVETFTIGINGLDSNFAFLEIYWKYQLKKRLLQTLKKHYQDQQRVIIFLQHNSFFNQMVIMKKLWFM